MLIEEGFGTCIRLVHNSPQPYDQGVDFTWTAEQIELRRQAHQVAKDSVSRFGKHNDTWMTGYSKEFSRELAAHGWLGMTWPKEFGGGGRPAIDRLIVYEEMITLGAPIAASWFGDRQMGPSLIAFGTADQQQRFLPDIISGETTTGSVHSPPTESALL